MAIALIEDKGVAAVVADHKVVAALAIDRVRPINRHEPLFSSPQDYRLFAPPIVRIGMHDLDFIKE